MYSKELRQKRINAGLCGHCGKNPLCNNTECKKCRNARSDYQKRAYKNGTTSKGSTYVLKNRAKRLSQGLCGRCGKHPFDAGKKTCSLCLNRVKALEKEAKDKVYAAYGGYVCNCCGETTKEFLTIDHIDNDGAEHRRKTKTVGGAGLYRWIIKNHFPKTFQILCYNCNCGKKHNGGICPHENKLSESSLQNNL